MKKNILTIFTLISLSVLSFSLKEQTTNLSSLKVHYKFDRYESTKNDCMFSPLNNVSYHSVAVLELTSVKNIDWRRLEKIELIDQKNNIQIIYTVDQEKSTGNKVFYYTPLFSKKKHYEFISLGEDGESTNSFYLFYYLEQYPKLKNKKSTIQVRGVYNNKTDAFTSTEAIVDLKRSFNKDLFPVLLTHEEFKNLNLLKIKFSNSSDQNSGYIQYKLHNTLIKKEFLSKKGTQSIDISIGEYDSYLAVTLVNNKGYESKTILYRSCDEHY